jgi:hypothetical protein
VVATHLLDEHRAVEADALAEPRHHADRDRQRQEAQDHRRPRVEARDREPAQDLAEEVLAADDVEQDRDAHTEHAERDAEPVDVGLAQERHQQRDPDRQRQLEEEERQRERQAGPQPLAEPARDRDVVGVAAAEVEREHAPEVLGDHGVARGVGVPEARLVVAVIRLPLLEGLGRRLLAERAARDVVGGGDDEEEDEEKEQHAEHRDGAVGDAAGKVDEDHRAASAERTDASAARVMGGCKTRRTRCTAA